MRKYLLFLLIIAWLPAPTKADWRNPVGKCVESQPGGCGGGGGGGGGGGSVGGLIQNLFNLLTTPSEPEPSPTDLRELQSVAFNEKGNAEFRRGNYAAALRYYETALELATTDKSARIDLNNIGNTYDHLGVAARERGDSSEALRLHQLALSHKLKAQRPEAELRDVRERIGAVYNDQGNLAYKRGDREQAIREYELANRYYPADAAIQKNLKSVQGELATERREKAEAMRQAEEARHAPNRRQAITGSIDALTASIVGSARDGAERDKALTGLIGELEKSTADGCFDGHPNCKPIILPKHQHGLRGSASLSAEVRQAMSGTPDGKRLLDEEAALRDKLASDDAKVVEIKKKMESPANRSIRAELEREYSLKEIEKSKTQQQLDFKEFEVQQKAADVTVVELRRRSDQR